MIAVCAEEAAGSTVATATLRALTTQNTNLGGIGMFHVSQGRKVACDSQSDRFVTCFERFHCIPMVVLRTEVLTMWYGI